MLTAIFTVVLYAMMALVQFAFIAGVFWLLLVLAGMKWPLFRKVRQIYGKMIWGTIDKVAIWLWEGPQRSGGAHMVAPPRLTRPEGDQWK